MNWFARELESLSGNGLDISYSYDENGMRLRKTVNGALTEYQYEGIKLIYEKRGEQEFYYTYDGLGNLSSITYYNNNAKQEYFVLCNSRGDVTELYTENGDLAAHYIYDSWGNTISVTDKNGNEITDENSIGLLNPIRYRGYYLDFETGYYYLQSRYYNPTVGRFLNADVFVFTNNKVIGTNIYAYCENNPVSYIDCNGYKSKDATYTIAAVITEIFVCLDLQKIASDMEIDFEFESIDDYKVRKTQIYREAFDSDVINLSYKVLNYSATSIEYLSILSDVLDGVLSESVVHAISWMGYFLEMSKNFSGRYLSWQGSLLMSWFDSAFDISMLTVSGIIKISGHPIIGYAVGLLGDFIYSFTIRKFFEYCAYNWYI